MIRPIRSLFHLIFTFVTEPYFLFISNFSVQYFSEESRNVSNFLRGLEKQKRRQKEKKTAEFTTTNKTGLMVRQILNYIDL